MPKSIPENILRAITIALNTHAPHLLGIIKDLVETSETQGSSGGMGDSAYGQLTGSIPQEQGKEISKALHEIEFLYGDSATFEGFQINYLAQVWAGFSSFPELPTQ